MPGLALVPSDLRYVVLYVPQKGLLDKTSSPTFNKVDMKVPAAAKRVK
jgi:hypothetical protein